MVCLFNVLDKFSLSRLPPSLASINCIPTIQIFIMIIFPPRTKQHSRVIRFCNLFFQNHPLTSLVFTLSGPVIPILAIIHVYSSLQVVSGWLGMGSLKQFVYAHRSIKLQSHNTIATSSKYESSFSCFWIHDIQTKTIKAVKSSCTISDAPIFWIVGWSL
jgi:hypothetical protein